MLVDTSPLPLLSRESKSFSFVFHPNRRRPAVLGFAPPPPPRSTGGLVGLCGGRRLGSRQSAFIIPKTLYFFVSREKARENFVSKKGNKKKICKNLDAKKRTKSLERRMKYDVTVPVGLGEWGAPKRREEIPEEEERDAGRRDEVVDALFTLDPANSMSSSEDEEEEDGAHLMIGNVRVDVERGKEKRAKKKENHIHWDYDDENNADDDADVNSLPSSSSSDSDEDMEGQLSDSAEYERQLKAIAGMALDGGNMVPSPGSSFGESSSSSKDDWTSRKGRQKALAKKRKAKREAQKQLIEEEELETYVESVMETLVYLGEGSYVGLPPGMTKMKLECVRDIVHQRSGGSPGWFVFETVGGGKWIHAVIRFTGNSPGANRSVMSHYGKESKDRTGKNRWNRQRGAGIRKNAAPVSFIKAGNATELTKVESSEEEEDDGGEPKVYANRGLRRAAEAERKMKALQKARTKASKGVPIDAGRNYAEFEQYGNAIGSKLMEKMGFTHGTGLGAKRDGKAEPVEAVMRKKRAGLGT